MTCNWSQSILASTYPMLHLKRKAKAVKYLQRSFHVTMTIYDSKLNVKDEKFGSHVNGVR